MQFTHLHLNRNFFVVCSIICSIMLSDQDLNAQINATVGDGTGSNHAACLFAPFRWQGEWGDLDYLDHVCYDSYGTKGQEYEEGIFHYDEWVPSSYSGYCTLETFADLISDYSNYIGTLVISTHGSIDPISRGHFSVECYELTPEGEATWADQVAYYGNYYEDGVEYYNRVVFPSGGSPGWYTIGVYEQFIRNYGNFNGSLIYMNSCKGTAVADAFCDAGARVAIGSTDMAEFGESYSEGTVRLRTVFSRMDGQEGIQSRNVYNAMMSPPDHMANLAYYGNAYTTLAPAVISVNAPQLLVNGDVIQINLDTQCDIYTTPYVTATWGNIESETWIDDHTLEVTYLSPYNYSGDDEFCLY